MQDFQKKMLFLTFTVLANRYGSSELVGSAHVFGISEEIYTAISKKVVIVNSRYWNRKNCGVQAAQIVYYR